MVELVKKVYLDRVFKNKDKDGKEYERHPELYFVRTKAGLEVALKPLNYTDKGKLDAMCDEIINVEKSK